MRNLLLTLSTFGLFALSSMVFNPMSDTFAKDPEDTPQAAHVFLEEINALDVDLSDGNYDITATLENLGDFEADVTVVASIYNEITHDFVGYLQTSQYIQVPPHERGAIDVDWDNPVHQNLATGIYSVIITVYEGYVHLASTPLPTPIAEGSALFDTEIEPGDADDEV